MFGMGIMENLMVGLIGVSHWHSRMYVDALMDIDGVKVVGVSDRDIGVAKHVAEKIGCIYRADYRELIEGRELDFVFAFGIHREMPEIIESLIDLGIAFMAEKPAGTDYKQLEPLVRRVEDEGLFASVAFAYRCSPWVKRLSELKRSGLLGEFLHGYYRYITGPPRRYVDWGCGWMLNKELSGGGCTINLAIHYIDLARHLTGSEVRRVYAVMGNRGFGLEIEDLSAIIMEMDDGSVHTVDVGYCNPSGGWNSTFSVTTRNYRVLVYGEECSIASKSGGEEKISLRGVNMYRSMVEETIKRYEAGVKPIASLRDCLTALKVVNKAYESDIR
ncbi:MAG: oxidoreductase domain-containing protein, partial [Candidatus Bathyarchaeota archaeon B63]